MTERCPFTITLDLRIEIFPEHRIIKWPNLQFRIYKDTKSAEVISFEQHRKFEYRYPLFNEKLFQPDEKSQANRYLGELLEHFMKKGYSLNDLEFLLKAIKLFSNVFSLYLISKVFFGGLALIRLVLNQIACLAL